MNNKLKVEIIIPFVDGHTKGMQSLMKKADAIKYEKEGIVKILKEDKKQKTKMVKIIKTNFNNPINDKGDALTQIITRQKELEGDNYLEVFAGDDKKVKKNILQKKFNVNTCSYEDITKTMKEFNKDSHGVFFNYNPTDKPQRLKVNIKKILYIFVDLDDANEEHNETIKTILNKYNITYSYNGKSGHGYHFLIPVDLEPNKELKVRAFLSYLKENICEKVDVATYTNERLFRVPLSLHHKDEDTKQLSTLHNHIPTDKEIKSNTKLMFKYQLEQKKGKKDIAYQNSIKKQDIFFSTLLQNKIAWNNYHKLLDKSKDRNDNFIKNLGFFISTAPTFLPDAESFLNNWQPARIPAMKGWAKKASEHNTPVLYHELLKWSRDNELKIFSDLLKEQTKQTFLDQYEVYYLEDEHKERAYLLYYPEKNYYVQKALPDVLQTIYYDCREQGVDIVKELGLELIDDWEDFSFKKQQYTILTSIHQKLESERRIKMVFNVNYEPSDNKFVVLDNKKYFNTYNKSPFWDYNKKSKKYGFAHIKDLIMNLCGETDESYNYFNKWLAWIIQNPLEKIPTAIIFQGKQGSGKGQFKCNILDNIFGNNCQEINQSHLESGFNNYLMGKQIIVANEVMHNENRQTLPNILKNLVTDEYITINRKFRNELVCRNYSHWIFCTNSDNPIKIEQDDRRYSVFYSEKLKGGGKAASEFVKSLRKNIDFELKEYISYLKSLRVEYSDVHEPIMTKAKEDIVELNKDSIERFVEYLKQFPTLNKAFNTLENKDFCYLELSNNGLKYILTDCMYLGYESYCTKFKERGVFNKQTFSKKISSKGIKNNSLYFSETKSSKRVYDLGIVESNLMEIAQ